MKILVVGDLMLDKYIIGEITRISPEAPVPVVHVVKEEYKLGGSSNVANNLAKLGVETHLLGAIGNDENGKILENYILKENITSNIIRTKSPTICKIRVIGSHQQIARIDYEDTTIQTEIEISILENILTQKIYDVIVISDYNKGFCTPLICQFLIKFAAENKIKILVDPKGNDWGKYQGSYLVTPNFKELQDISGIQFSNEDSSIEKIGLSIKKHFRIKHLIITRAEHGISHIDESNQVHHYPTDVQEVYDVSGAGDTVLSVLAKSLSENLTFKESINLANLAAGYVISKFGTYAISQQELMQLQE